jgi:DNA polymerase-3 subunit gamma/tau
VDEHLDEREAVLDLAERMDAEDVQLFYQIGLIGRRDLQMAPDLRGGLEMVLLRMLAFRPASVEQSLRAEQPAPLQTRKVPSPEQLKTAARVAAQAQSPAAAPGNDWRSLVERMQLKGVLRELAMNCALRSNAQNNWELVLNTSNQQLLSKERQQRLERSLCEVLQQTVHVEIEVQGSAGNTPAQQQLQEAEMRQADAVNAIESDPNVKAIQKGFDATLHRETIRSVD